MEEEGSTKEEQFLQLLGGIYPAMHTDAMTILKKIMNTVKEMLQDRGCQDIDIAKSPLRCISQQLPIFTSNSTYVYFHDEAKIGVKFAREIKEQNDIKNVRSICISTDGPTPFTKRECDSSIQFFLAKTLCMNVTKHRLVPKHEAVTEVPNVTDVSLLPSMLDTDAICQYYDWPIGTVVKITRTFGGHEPVFYWRLIVPST